MGANDSPEPNPLRGSAVSGVRRHIGVTSLVNSEQEAYVCIFCNEAIYPGPLDPCALQVVARLDRPRDEQKEQTFFCHIGCLQERATTHPGNFYIADLDFPTVGEQGAA